MSEVSEVMWWSRARNGVIACALATAPGLLVCLTPAVALASEGAKAAEKGAEETGLLGPPMLYTIQWALLLLLLATTVLFIIVSYAPELRRRTSAASTKIVLGFSALQVLLVFGVLIANFLGEEYFEPSLPGYIRHVTLIVTGVLLAVSGLMARRRRV